MKSPLEVMLEQHEMVMQGVMKSKEGEDLDKADKFFNQGMKQSIFNNLPPGYNPE